MTRTASLVLLIATFLLASILAATPAFAGVGAWTSLGPDGGPVRSLAVDPSNPRVVYAGTLYAGFYKSVDGGDTWALTGRGLPVGDFSAIAFDAQRSSTLYVMVYGTGVYRSTDAGRTWKITSPQGRPFQQVIGLTVATDPRRPRVLYAGTRAGVYRSANGGATWKPRSQGLPPGSSVGELVIDPRTGTLYAGLQSHGIYRSDDQAATWRPASTGLPDEVSVPELALDPAGSGTMLAGTDQGVYRSTDRGRTWHFAGGPVEIALALAFQRGGRAYAGYTESGIFRSLDAGATWQPAQEAPPPAAVLDLAAGPEAVFAGTADGRELNGVFRSQDSGATWEPSQRDLTALSVRAVAVDPSDPRTLYASVELNGLVKSTDGGASWRPLDLPAGGGAIQQILVHPLQPSTVYVSLTLNGPLLRSDDGGETWRVLGQLPPQGFSSANDMAADPRTPDALWVAGGIGLFHSSDSGVNWQPINLGSEYLVIDVVKVSPRDPNVIFAAGMAVLEARPPRYEARVFRSVDGGRTWQRRDAGLPGQDIQELALDPADPATLWASTGQALYRSTDGGASWRQVQSALPDGVFTHLAAAPGVLYVTRQGPANSPSAVLRSTDGGETWKPLQPGLGFRVPSILVIDPQDPDHLFLGTWSGSLLTWTEP